MYEPAVDAPGLPAARPLRPLPAASPATDPYWEAARNRTLAIQRCLACRLFAHPPDLRCPYCQSADREFTPVSGLGTVFQLVVVRESRTMGFEESVPYLGATIELDEQPGLFVVSGLRAVSIEAARIGLRVRVLFEEVAEGWWLPQFEPAEPVG
jgi:uncharacterized OB-fold protein